MGRNRKILRSGRLQISNFRRPFWDDRLTIRTVLDLGPKIEGDSSLTKTPEHTPAHGSHSNARERTVEFV